MKKTISRIGCFLLAILLGLYSVAIPADADALSPGEWFVTGYYRVTSDGVMGYSYGYVMDGGAQEIESSLYAGQVVYARIAYSSMGVTWYSCSSEDEHGDGFNYVWYGWVDASYLVPVGQEPEPEPEFVRINVMERIVSDKIIYFMRQFECCTCEKCIADTIALTLNGLPPKYIVTEPAAEAPLLSFYTNHFISEITVEATKACMTVKENPRHKNGAS